MRVYIEDLACYNQGFGCVVGKWIDLGIDKDELSEMIKQILEEGTKLCKDITPHEEWSINDSEGFPMNVGEYDDVFMLNDIALKMDGLEENQIKVIKFLLGDNICNDIEEAIEHMDDVMIYENMSMSDIAEEFINNSIDIDSLPELIRYHIDYEGIGRDLYLDGRFYKVDGNIYEVCF